MATSKLGGPRMQDILDLAKLLRANGDQVLNGSSKLSLSTKLLRDLNDAFLLIVDDSKDLECSFQVCNSSEIDVFRDLKFLHDFVQKTIWLKISYTPAVDTEIPIDITKFRHLRYLELQKIAIDSVNGIQGVRGQLESISCTGRGGVGTICCLLTTCGRDAGVGFVWPSLKRLALPYNGLDRLDKSLELAPWLQTIDLSHNFISAAVEIDCLPNLKYVNFSYNKLESVPSFNRATYRTLRILVLKNNYMDNLNGLQGLDCLAELDVSYNCLADHSLLWPLETMTTLLWVMLEGNPLAYHNRHRILTIKHLHSSLAENKFVLDHLPLSKSEKLLLSENRLFTIRSMPVKLSSKDNDLTNSFTSSINYDATNVSLQTTIPNNSADLKTQELSNSIEKSMTKMKKIHNVKEAVIADDEVMKSETPVHSNLLSTSYLETSTDHLETKKQILAVREKFGGDKWLSSDAGTFIQDLMGIERSSDSVLELKSSTDNIPTIANTSEVSENVLEFNCTASSLQGESSIIPEDNAVSSEEILNESLESVVEQCEEIIDDKKIDENSHQMSYDPEEETDMVFLVQKKTSDGESFEQLFLIITSDDIKEKDSISGKIKYRWSNDTILSCVMGRGQFSTIDIIFDTTRRDRQNRTYYVEYEDAEKIVEIISDVIKKRPILLKVFKCMKCPTHFSQDPDHILNVTQITASNMKPPMCPSCSSTLVIQTDELLTPDADFTKNSDESEMKKPIIREKSNTPKEFGENQSNTVNLQHSASHSSIGQTEGGETFVTTSMVYIDSQAQAQDCCSATSLEESRESTPSTSTITKKYESDIEILSNPSQSSIEILEDGSKSASASTPKRKRSSEERRIAIAPTLLTIPDTTSIMAGLTESSSSGSLTDSICTAYENKNVQMAVVRNSSSSQSINEYDKTIIGPITDNINSPASNLTSIFGGLLQSMKIGTNHRNESPMEDNNSDSLNNMMEYSYTDFKDIDHSVKLYLILNVFEQENEKFVLLLRSEILMENQVHPFPGCLVLSTLKMYILKIIGPEGDNPQQWLRKEISWTMDRLRTFTSLPFKQGVLVEVQQPNRIGEERSNSNFLCILQDFQRTSNFLFYLTYDILLPPHCEVEFSVPVELTYSIRNLTLASEYRKDGDFVRIFALFSSAKLEFRNRKTMLNIGGLIVTTSALILTEDRIHWLLPEFGEKPKISRQQSISNLIEVIFHGEFLGLNFLDEAEGIEELWNLKFVSSNAAEAVINSIKSPWEDLFSVPLQVTNITKQKL